VTAARNNGSLPRGAIEYRQSGLSRLVSHLPDGSRARDPWESVAGDDAHQSNRPDGQVRAVERYCEV